MAPVTGAEVAQMRPRPRRPAERPVVEPMSWQES
jgi:hypothetical protein